MAINIEFEGKCKIESSPSIIRIIKLRGKMGGPFSTNGGEEKRV
jgi:hypothetical protein